MERQPPLRFNAILCFAFCIFLLRVSTCLESLKFDLRKHQQHKPQDYFQQDCLISWQQLDSFCLHVLVYERLSVWSTVLANVCINPHFLCIWCVFQLIASLKREILSLKEELAMVTGEQRDDRLTPEEIQKYVTSTF